MNLMNWNPNYSTVCTLHHRRLLRRYHAVREAVKRSPSHTHRPPHVPSDVLAVLGIKHRVIRGFFCCSPSDAALVDAYLSQHGIYHTVSGRCIEMACTGEYYLVR